MLADLRTLWSNEQAEELIEYSLLLAFVTLSATSLFINWGNPTSASWAGYNSLAPAANQAGS